MKLNKRGVEKLFSHCEVKTIPSNKMGCHCKKLVGVEKVNFDENDFEDGSHFSNEESKIIHNVLNNIYLSLNIDEYQVFMKLEKRLKKLGVLK